MSGVRVGRPDVVYVIVKVPPPSGLRFRKCLPGTTMPGFRVLPLRAWSVESEVRLRVAQYVRRQ